MAQTTLLTRTFDQGFKSDYPRDQMPAGVAWRMKDWIPDHGDMPYGRGGYTYWSGNLNSVHAASHLSAVGWAAIPEITTATSPTRHDFLVMVDENGDVFWREDPADPSGDFYLGSAASAVRHPVIQHNKFAILLNDAGALYKVYKLGTTGDITLAAVGGTPPICKAVASWGDYLLVGNIRNKANRLGWSDVGAFESWVTYGLTAGSFWDFPDEIVAIAPLKNMILVFGYRDTWSLVGDIPPPGGNMARKDLALGNGCLDPRSVARWKDNAIWVNTNGIWKSDGSAPINIAEQAGILKFWQSTMSGFSGSQGWIAAGGVYYNHYFITIRNATGSAYTSLAINLDTYVVTELTNIKAAMYASRVAGPGGLGYPSQTVVIPGDEELFFAHDTLPRAGRISPIFVPPPTSGVDADGTGIQPVLETPFYMMGTTGLKRIRRAFFTWEVFTDGSSSPTLSVGVAVLPESSSYSTIGALTEAIQAQTKRTGLRVARRSRGVSFKITQTDNSVGTRLGMIEADAHVLEDTRGDVLST